MESQKTSSPILTAILFIILCLAGLFTASLFGLVHLNNRCNNCQQKKEIQTYQSNENNSPIRHT